MKKRVISLLLGAALIFPMILSLSGCMSSAKAADLMESVTPDSGIESDPAAVSDSAAAVSDFALQLFNESISGNGNVLISPVSVLYALSMTANGAEGETLSQMEAVLGLPVETLNEFIYAYTNSLTSGDKYKLELANSIWFKDSGFTADKDFLQVCADYYDASLYSAPFDSSTLKDINSWVEDNTDGMIKNILDNIPDSAVMYLINALTFDAEWQSIYYDYQVGDGVFTTEGGDIRDVELMYSTEHKYIADENASGFIKNYADGKYAFAALLPNEGVSVADYAASLTGEKLMDILNNAEEATVNAAIPKFETEFSVEMSGILKSMGMKDAFDVNTADLSGLGSSDNGNIFISRVLHKTFISVDERGTKAGAATVVAADTGCAMPTEIKEVYLDRPFVYMIIDHETNLPLFIGTEMDVGT